MDTSHSRIHTIRFVENARDIDHAEADARRTRTRDIRNRVSALIDGDAALQRRWDTVVRLAIRTRASEYHLTNACNIRCKGCWFFEYGHDKETRETNDLAKWEEFVKREASDRKINAPMIIGGEPSLMLDRLRIFGKHMRFPIVSTNGLSPIPYEGFEHFALAITLFGGGPLDDELRAIKPSGKKFTGLFDSALRNYANDPRAVFVYALTEDGIDYIEDTVRRIRDNGNLVIFNFYSKYDSTDPLAQSHQRDLLAEALRVKALCPSTIISHPYVIETMITGKTHWSSFSYDVCPSISVDHPANHARKQNGNPFLPVFNAWSPDLKTLKLCCTSGHCSSCRDSQAVFSWLMVSADRFLDSREQLTTWVELAESYWAQFAWSPLHPKYGAKKDPVLAVA